MTGALIAAPTAHDLAAGSEVLMSIDGQMGRVVIRRVAPGDAKGETLYGVEFIEGASPLNCHVNSHFTRLESAIPGEISGRRQLEEWLQELQGQLADD